MYMHRKNVSTLIKKFIKAPCAAGLQWHEALPEASARIRVFAGACVWMAEATLWEGLVLDINDKHTVQTRARVNEMSESEFVWMGKTQSVKKAEDHIWAQKRRAHLIGSLLKLQLWNFWGNHVRVKPQIQAHQMGSVSNHLNGQKRRMTPAK